MLDIGIAIIGIILTILFVVGTHEFGHFITARMLNVKVLRFSIGFGKKLLYWKGKTGTEYVFALIPLGGYVKMLDETEGDVPENQKHLAYNCQPLYKKFLIVLAGPLTNLICAFILYWLIFVIGFMTIKPITGEITPGSIAYNAGLRADQQIIRINNEDTPSWMSILFKLLYKTGDTSQITIDTENLKGKQPQQHTLDLTNWHMDNLKPDPLKSLGINTYQPAIPTTIGVIEPNTPASASLKQGDKITAIGKSKVTSWQEVVTIVRDNPGKQLPFTIMRDGKKKTVPITIASKSGLISSDNYGFLGAAPEYQLPKDLIQEVKYSPITAIGYAYKEVANFTYLNFFLIGKMITGKLSLQSMGGPITIFSHAGEALNSGLISFLGFLAFLSIAIGVINFLPIPGLDGGHLLIQIIESIIRRPVPERMLVGLYKLGLLFIVFLLFQSLANDILRLM